MYKVNHEGQVYVIFDPIENQAIDLYRYGKLDIDLYYAIEDFSLEDTVFRDGYNKVTVIVVENEALVLPYLREFHDDLETTDVIVFGTPTGFKRVTFIDLDHFSSCCLFDECLRADVWGKTLEEVRVTTPIRQILLKESGLLDRSAYSPCSYGVYHFDGLMNGALLEFSRT